MSLITIIMEKRATFNYSFLILIIVLLTLSLNSCNTEEGKEFASFFVGFIIFLVGTVVVGIPGIVMSAVSISSKHKALPILAIVFTALYLVFFIMMVGIFADSSATDLEGSVSIFPLITIAIIIMNIVFIIMGYKNRAKKPISSADGKGDILDDIINDDSLI